MPPGIAAGSPLAVSIRSLHGLPLAIAGELQTLSESVRDAKQAAEAMRPFTSRDDHLATVLDDVSRDLDDFCDFADRCCQQIDDITAMTAAPPASPDDTARPSGSSPPSVAMSASSWLAAADDVLGDIAHNRDLVAAAVDDACGCCLVADDRNGDCLLDAVRRQMASLAASARSHNSQLAEVIANPFGDE